MSAATDLAIGIGKCGSHHGEILQGVFDFNGGRVIRGHVTLPCPMFGSLAKFLIAPIGEILLYPSPTTKPKAARAAKLTLLHLNRPEQGGVLFLGSNSPERWGLGSSTSDVVASIKAVADAFNVVLSSSEIARIAVEAETASDALMFGPNAVLFAHREGLIVEAFERPLPGMEVLGFDTDPTHSGVDTLLYPPADYTGEEIERFRQLRSQLRQAIIDQDAGSVGAVATASARINQRFLPKPRFPDVLSLAHDQHAIGVHVAHSGSVMGLLFEPAPPGPAKNVEESVMGLRSLGFHVCYRFTVGCI